MVLAAGLSGGYGYGRETQQYIIHIDSECMMSISISALLLESEKPREIKNL